ncbi:hypothetical protein BT93_I1107 [Corymbia citriodora subsp. variegata]|nr:hypothetical protein BT93_I1107 [Corymbia citriodora subsp. variegata]
MQIFELFVRISSIATHHVEIFAVQAEFVHLKQRLSSVAQRRSNVSDWPFPCIILSFTF